MFSKLLGRKASAIANPRVPDGSRVYAVGDIHGRLDLIEKMHGLIAADAADFDGSRKVVIYLGDYIDRGEESRQVVDFLLDNPLPGFESIYLKGNHEDSLIKFLSDTSIGSAWMRYGGDSTLYSYGVTRSSASRDQRSLEQMQAYLKRNLSTRHLEFYQTLKAGHIEGDYCFVHAGVLPGVPLDEQKEENVLWIRGEFLGSKANHGKVVVHGHTIRPEPEVLPNRIGIDTGAYSSGILTCLALEEDSQSFLRT
ncbi:MAG: serine/threonine protein phosphatase [Alphaproteobacteria bacterium]|nr:serine/threonine protein phosphatase [Alphaproteobacteria bacterium]